jgi:hypothetical protein
MIRSPVIEEASKNSQLLLKSRQSRNQSLRNSSESHFKARALFFHERHVAFAA